MDINLKNIDEFSINDYLGNDLHCQCGKVHKVELKRVLIEKDAIKKLPDLLKEFGYKKALIVEDTHTFKAAGCLVEEILTKAKFSYNKLEFTVNNQDLVPNEEAVGKLLINIEKDTQVLIAIGTGTINDLCKFVSVKAGIDTIIVATAPSMDGFASTGAALIVENLKTTFNAACPKAIIGDINILKNAPMKMILAGFGDIVGKYSALNDWKLSKVINGEYYCDVIEKMVSNSVKKCIDNTEGIKKREDTAVNNLMEALVLTGIAMSFAGNSRPASGSEHHIAHYWEMMFLFDGKKAILHGAKVGIATVLISKIHEIFAEENIDFDEAIKNVNSFDEVKWQEEVNKFYKKAAHEIIDVNNREKRNSIDERLKRINTIKNNINKIKEIISDVPSTKEIKLILKKAGAPTNPREIGIDKETVENTILMAKEVRTRYTILQFLWDLGLLEKFSHEIGNYVEKDDI